MAEDGVEDNADEYIDSLSWGQGAVNLINYQTRIRLFLLGITVSYVVVAVASYYLIVPAASQVVFTLSFALVGVVLALAAIWFGTLPTSAQHILNTSVITYPGSYSLDGHNFAVTIFNAGRGIVIREMDLVVGSVKRMRSLGAALAGIPPFAFDVRGSAILMKGAQPLESEAVVRLNEQFLVGGLNFLMAQKAEVVQGMTEGNQGIYLMLFDNFAPDPPLKEGGISGLVSACRLGTAREFFDAVREKKPLPVYREGLIRMGPADEKGKMPAQMISGSPPSQSRDEYLMERVDSIKKLLEEIRDSSSKRKKNDGAGN